MIFLSSCRRDCSCNLCNPCFIPGPQGPPGQPGAPGQPGPAGQPGPGGALAYGSLYNVSNNFIRLSPPSFLIPGPKVIFGGPPGPLLGTTPVGTTDLQVLSDGVYEISMDLTVALLAHNDEVFGSAVAFGLYINDTLPVPGSIFWSSNTIGSSTSIGSETQNTIGKTIQQRLNANDRLSIIPEFALGDVKYLYPSLVVTKIAN